MGNKLSLISNPHRGKEQPEWIKAFDQKIADQVQIFHQQFAEYTPTPLIDLPKLARKLGISGLFVKDESRRFGLGAFKGLGGSYCLGRYLAEHPDQNGVTDIGGTLRLGSYPCVLDKTTKAYALYGEAVIQERHRHRYEINNAYRKELQGAGLTLSGLSPDGRIVEMIELKSHPFFLATQAHPELKSRPNRPHPLFRGFVAAALEHKKTQ